MTADTHESSRWPELHRVRRAIVVVDVVESVRLMQQHEDDVIDRWRRFVHEVRTEVLPAHGGRMVKSLGDGMLLEFGSSSDALAAAMALHHRCAAANAGVGQDRAIWLKAGVHQADVVVDDIDMFGSGVNLAARLSGMAGPGEVIASAEVRDGLVPGLDGDFEDLGNCYLKHLDAPVRAYRVQAPHDRAAVAVSTGVVPEVDDPFAPPSRPVRPVLAVMALHELASADPASMLGDLIAAQLNASLSRSPAINVISRMSTSAVRGRELAPAMLRKHLGAHFVLTGQCRRSGLSFAFDLELVDTRHGHVLWAQGAHAPMAELLSGNSETLFAAAQAAIGAVIAHELRHAVTSPLYALEDHSLLMHGIALMHSNSRPAFERSRMALEAAIERLPRHPEPRAWLAKWHVMRAHQGWSDDIPTDTGRAREHAARALDIEPHSTLALTMDGLVNVHMFKRLDVGAQRYAQALAIDPNESLAWLLQGALHAFRGEGPQSVHDTMHAISLSPLDPLRYYYESLAATAALTAGELGRSIELARSSLRRNATHMSTLRVLTIALALDDQGDEARRAADRLLLLDPGFTLARFRERAPDGGQAVVRRFEDALRQAGVPE